jgi:hypothetical protein
MFLDKSAKRREVFAWAIHDPDPVQRLHHITHLVLSYKETMASDILYDPGLDPGQVEVVQSSSH